MFSNIYKNKKVIVTGHTGFKGSWLTTWLIKNGAKVVGTSKDIPTNPSMFVELKLKNKIKHYIEDIPIRAADIQEAKKKLNWEPKYDISQSIKKTITSYLKDEGYLK